MLEASSHDWKVSSDLLRALKQQLDTIFLEHFDAKII